MEHGIFNNQMDRRNNRMKKTLLFVLALAMALSVLTACGGNNIPGGYGSSPPYTEPSDSGVPAAGNTSTPSPNKEEATYENFIRDDTLQTKDGLSGITDELIFKTEEYARISFSIDASWGDELADDGRKLYYPAVDEQTGFIQCQFVEIPIGTVSEENAGTVLDGGINGMRDTFNNPVEMSRKHYKIGNNYAARAAFYSDIDSISDGAKLVCDAVTVIFDDGVAFLLAIFPPVEYEETYKDAIEKALSSVSINQANIPQTAPDSAPASTPGKVAWKDFLNEYETWVDNYIVLLQKYKDNPSDLSIMLEYLDMMQAIVEWSDKAENIEVGMSSNELTEYLETLTRITAKLNTAIQSME